MSFNVFYTIKLVIALMIIGMILLLVCTKVCIETGTLILDSRFFQHNVDYCNSRKYCTLYISSQISAGNKNKSIVKRRNINNINLKVILRQ